MIYPRLAWNGRDLAWGNDGIFVNGRPAPPVDGDDRSYGTSPVWANDFTIYYTYSRHNPDGSKHKLDGQLVRLIYPFLGPAMLVGIESGNVLTAGGNEFALWRPNSGIITSGGINFPGHSPALSQTAHIAFGTNGDGTANYAWGSTTIARENSPNLELIVDINGPGGWIQFNPEPLCGKPIPVWTGHEILILFHTNDGCVFLMELDTKLGYVIEPRNWDGGGSGYTHDAKMYDSETVRCVSPGFDVLINIHEPRVPLPPLDKPEPIPMPCTPVVPQQNIIRDSTDNIRRFCQEFTLADGSKPYANDEIHENGLFLSDGLLYFMMSDTGLWAKILMNPDDKRPWNEKRIAADNALFDYMRKRFQ